MFIALKILMLYVLSLRGLTYADGYGCDILI